MIKKYKEYLESFQELPKGKKVIFIITWLLLTILIIFISYYLLHLFTGGVL